MKREMLTIALMAAGGILGSIAQETVKSSIDMDDAIVSAGAAAGTLFLATKLNGDLKHVANGAASIMAMSAISDGANTLAQKTSNPTVSKLVALLPRVSAPNVLANPSISAPVDNFEDATIYEEDDEGVDGLGYLNDNQVDIATLVR